MLKKLTFNANYLLMHSGLSPIAFKFRMYFAFMLTAQASCMQSAFNCTFILAPKVLSIETDLQFYLHYRHSNIRSTGCICTVYKSNCRIFLETFA